MWLEDRRAKARHGDLAIYSQFSDRPAGGAEQHRTPLQCVPETGPGRSRKHLGLVRALERPSCRGEGRGRIIMSSFATRVLVVFLCGTLALIAGFVAAILTVVAGASVATSVLAGGAAVIAVLGVAVAIAAFLRD